MFINNEKGVDCKVKINRYIICFFITALIVGATGCVRNTNTETKTETKIFELDDAKRVAINVKMGAGEMDIQGGSDKLMEGEFTYNVPKWKPTAKYSKTGNNGTINIEQTSSNTKVLGDKNRNEWNLKLNKNILTDISLLLGAGNGNIRLNDMNLENVDVKMGAGKLDMDLSGEWKKDVVVNVEGGVGNISIILPKNIAVVVNVTKGIGKINADGFILSGDSYVNDAYGKSDITMHVKIETGIGATNLRLEE